MQPTAIRVRNRMRSAIGLHAVLFVVIGAAIVAGCGGKKSYQSGYGVDFLTVSNTPGNFSSYRVLMTSLTLTRSDRAVVTVSGAAESVDFAQLNDVSELFSASVIPIGTYTSATLTLDYTTAAIAVNVNGVATSATPVNAAGAALTTVSVTTKFDPKNPLVINSGQGQRLDINLNLSASSSINFASSPIKVVMQPFFTVSTAPPVDKLIRIRGPLISYNTALQTFTVYVRPFHDVISSLGTLTLFAKPTTTYAIDNLSFTGASGLSAITNLTTGTVVAGYTTYQPDSKAGTFTVTQVYAGTALESGLADVLEGTVIARSGDTLTIRGGTLAKRTGATSYVIPDATLKVAAGTLVKQDGAPDASGLNKNSISIGQHVVAIGQATVSTAGVVSFDASSGQVRLAPTRVWGSLVSGAAGSAAVNLQSIGEWPASVLNFAGTGTSTAQDATPANYLLATGSVDLTGVTAGTMLAADGIVAPFGSAPPDFVATAVSNTKGLDSRLVVEWAGGTTAPFSSTSSSNLVINLANASLGTVHMITVGPNNTDLKTLPSSPSIVANTSVKSQFAIGSAAAGISVYTTFSDFLAQITADAAKTVVRFEATGRYDPPTNTFTANSINIAEQ